jgi:hypothetical protein
MKKIYCPSMFSLLIVIALFQSACNTKSGEYSPVKLVVNPPKPRLVESHGNEDPTSSMFHFYEGVWATVLNEGGSGKVLVKATLTQDGHTWQRSQDFVLGENSTKDVHFVFTEPSRVGGDMKYEVTTEAME